MSTLRLGSTGFNVRRWQSIVDAEVDGIFGPKTELATRSWQTAHDLEPDGIVGSITWATYLALSNNPPFVQAKHFDKDGMGSVHLIVIHTMEWGETVNTAESCASFFTNPIGPNGPVVASAHYCIDSDTIVQCVNDKDAAYHTPGYVDGREVNRVSIGIEHAGYARQSADEWADPYSTAMLTLSAELIARLCKHHGVPIRHLTDDELRSGEAGLVGHADCTRALGAGTHTDPGPNFPWSKYLELVQSQHSRVSRGEQDP